MDEFAQSREDDDLFADEFEPIPTPTAIVEQPELSPIPDQPRPSAAAAKPTPPAAGGGPSQQQQQHQQQQRNGRQEGGRERRGRGGGRGGSNGLNQSRYAPSAESSPSPSSLSQAVPPPTAPTTTTTTSASLPSSTSATTQSDTAPPPSNTNTQPTADNTRTHAVRGDRSATGGPAHKKLTEEELTEKMAKMAILNAQKAEKHRLTEADQAAFQHREKELAKERREKAIAEKKNERVMEMERAKNRERKMKAQGGREWDSEKVESDIVDGRGRGRSSEFVRGGHGGVIRGARGGLAASRYSVDDGAGADIQESQPSRGRGGFEIRGRGRGGRGGGRGGKAANANTVPSAEDFPSLPTPAKAPEALKKDVTSDEKVKSPTVEKPAGDWAEEMATPVEEKKLDV
ncbi:hypothetical protein BKA61DRAFT_607484 [Leptodontidium sp. MPI-SDFR-AT-0119]|nr:hypothetical protein BKA61DRAFT_607484 [Leptodontidium sp. MPI-SDFR-AT-0119]